jgi:hypothetical protein
MVAFGEPKDIKMESVVAYLKTLSPLCAWRNVSKKC